MRERYARHLIDFITQQLIVFPECLNEPSLNGGFLERAFHIVPVNNSLA